MDDTGGQDLPNTRGDEAVMAIEITVPTLGESVADATVARWIKTTGDAVAADEPVVELETDKVTLEVPAPAAGTLGEILAAEGATVEVGASLAMLNEGAAPAAPAPKAPAKSASASPAPATPAPAPAAPAAAASAAAGMPLGGSHPGPRRRTPELLLTRSGHPGGTGATQRACSRHCRSGKNICI